ncbi:ribonuclease H1 domain-containing protein [Pelosinus propionicus]|uniref:Ribonuclease H n=1 Tax=Pelosinus propionicus DSM 13327 TaxID=1123291 RepID=A0A1I4J1R3_9FIRM|nr:ribonuclease H family protein [Pelosinus propionicus]SFL60545.1 ribonuclease HI [Pelosinus propionicus DSM 13327]
MSDKQKKVYAVRKGRKNGLFYTWPQCQEQIKGFSGAEYKSFKTEEEANAYLTGSSCNVILPSLPIEQLSDDMMLAYVDGSYNIVTKEYSAGVVILWKGAELTFSQKGNDPELSGMRNVAGETMGAKIAMNYALEQGVRTIVIYYDYEGIEKWCTNAWEAKQEGTKKYKQYYDQVVKQLEVIFVKVKAHSGDKYNEQADQLAKAALQLI